MERKDKDKRKAARKAEKVAKLLGYTNETNPFGDSNLLQPFVWGKKQQENKFSGKEDFQEDRLTTINEIEKVRKRRIDRENELSEIERLRSEEQRIREAASYGDWQKKEEDFHLEQIKVRSKIRLVENRAKPIDLLSKNILLLEAALIIKDSNFVQNSNQLGYLLELDPEVKTPSKVINNLSIKELSEIKSDVESFLFLEQQEKKSSETNFEEFWQNMLFVVERTKIKQTRAQAMATKKQENQQNNDDSDDDKMIHRLQENKKQDSLEEDIDKLLKGKSLDELENLKFSIEKNLQENTYGANTDYWLNLVDEIALQQANLKLSTMHKNLLKKLDDVLNHLRNTSMIKTRTKRKERTDEENDENNLDRNDASIAMKKAFDDNKNNNSLDSKVIEENMDAKDEVVLSTETYSWQGKFRPRKPRYFNRVKSGWDWNKYNQTHYDYDNPPPKVIQGYKFTIFYPDLIDKNKTPKYFIEPSDSDDFVILRFHAGPPYEDVAFKILNKEWDVHRKSGFRNIFEKGILQLHFNFMRSFYRR